ncbi:hypothetical protein [uncultured Rhodoferax sp.]|uniref:hypothetical protein n=1 Tax=uncultured Rhodoferax sp. TaxID=223188 RepID=UPI0025D12148|nr:hypothetical protein [uncultured Rhodoferax sp.]
MAPWMAAVHLLLTVVLAALAALQWGRSPQGRLRWDGEQWWWADAPVPRLRCVLDAQAVVLLALELGARRPVWLWLERRQGPATAWRALRRALVHAGHADPRTPEPAHEALP